MLLKISERLRPFSHLPGTLCPLPGTARVFQVFPAMLRTSFEGNVEEIPLDIRGPVERFTVSLDLEKGLIRVWGREERGYFRYRIQAASESDWEILAEKGLLPFSKREREERPPLSLERLSLGCHRAQDWQMVCRRGDLAEIFPFWYRLGQLVPQEKSRVRGGTLSLLEDCFGEEELYVCFEKLFKAGFEGILSPKLIDDLHLGFDLPQLAEEDSAFPLLSEGWLAIRRLLVEESGEVFRILPRLPKQFHAGRLLDAKVGNGLSLSLEWSKKRIKKIAAEAALPTELNLSLERGIESFRLRREKGDRGSKLQANKPLKLQPGRYFLDRFT